MAVNTKMPLTNTADGYLCEGTDVRGGYFVIDEIKNISSRITTKGSLCYVTGTTAAPVNKFYQYNGTAWVEKVFGITSEATSTASGLMSKEDKAQLDLIVDSFNNEAANTTIDTIKEVLKAFENAPEGTDIANALANKSDVGHNHSVELSGTTSSNSGSGVTVATGRISASGTGDAVVTGVSGTATVLTGVEASSTDTFVKAIAGGSGNLTSNTTSTDGNDIKYVEDISNTPASASGTAKAGSEDHTHSYFKPTKVDLGSNETIDGGVQYIEDVSYTAPTLSGTTTFNTNAIKEVALSASSTPDEGLLEYVESVSHSPATLTGETTFVTAQGTLTPGTLPSLTITSKSLSNISDWNPGTTPISGADPKNESTASGSAGSATIGSYDQGVLTISNVPAHTHQYDKTTGIKTTLGTSPSLTYSNESVGSAGDWNEGSLPSLSAEEYGTVDISGGSINKTTKYLKTTATAADTASVGISGGSISKTTKYFHPEIATTSANTGRPSETTTFVTGVTGGTTSATTKYLHHTHSGASVSSSAKAVTGVSSNGTVTVVTSLATKSLETTVVAPNEHTHGYESSVTTGEDISPVETSED